MASPCMTSTVDSEALAALAAQGHADALGELYEHYSDKLYRWVLAKIGGVHHVAEDVCQDTWLRVARNIRGYEPTPGTTGFSGWLFRIAYNLIADTGRALSKRRETLTEDMLTVPHAITEGPGGLDTPLAGPLAEALRKINQRRAQVVVLRFFSGLTVDETADVLGVKPGVVRTLQSRALKDLKHHLGDLLVADSETNRVRPLRGRADTKRGVNA